MLRIIMRGCNGRMGQVISDIVKGDAEAEIVAGIDLTGEQKNDYPVFTHLQDCKIEADVVIDFTSTKGLTELLTVGKERKLPIVLCTTGFDEAQLAEIEEASKEVAILRSANMSLGINTLSKLAAAAAKILAEAGFDMEIVERHHNKKVDAPSGTALILADSINDAMDKKYHYTYDRSTRREARDPNEIGISAVRGGTIVGEHEIIFAGLDEVIELKHTAYSRSVFATGAVQAAKYLAGKPAGMYNMNAVVGK
ncbi:MAG: 4-hydroxy-tetrahydrodipicolinate reductase [Lachnospiraceae bacterium]|nr:4-hydroxy-tetrahydrodipicolinate reductase [Lachnospiraceae bacterium]